MLFREKKKIGTMETMAFFSARLGEKGTGESDSDSFEKIRKEDGGINHMG